MKGQSVLSIIKNCNENFKELNSCRVSENKPELESVPEIYNECQNEAADEFPSSSKEAFLQNFTNFKACQSTLYKERRTKVPPTWSTWTLILNLKDLSTLIVGKNRASSKVML